MEFAFCSCNQRVPAEPDALRRHASLLGLAAHVDLEQDAEPAPRRSGAPLELRAEARAVDALDAVKVAHRVPRLVALEGADHVPAHLGGNVG